MPDADAARLIAANLAQVQAAIADAAHGRDITLCCVTKYARPEWVQSLLAAGAEHLAENLLPQAAERFHELTAAGFRFQRHLIGAQQSRKLSLIPGNFDWLHALDRLSSAEALHKHLEQAGATLNTLLQVNIAEEPQKHGFAPAEVEAAYAEISERYPQLRLRGLMAIPPWPDAYTDAATFERGTRGYFSQMRALFDKIRTNLRGALHTDTLSLGMSSDYVWAIAEGATMVRIGSALFSGLEG